MKQYLQVKSYADGRWYWIALGPPVHIVENQSNASAMEDDVVILIMKVWQLAAPHDEVKLVVVGA